jgi:hypothetical protein
MRARPSGIKGTSLDIDGAYFRDSEATSVTPPPLFRGIARANAIFLSSHRPLATGWEYISKHLQDGLG